MTDNRLTVCDWTPRVWREWAERKTDELPWYSPGQAGTRYTDNQKKLVSEIRNCFWGYYSTIAYDGQSYPDWAISHGVHGNRELFENGNLPPLARWALDITRHFSSVEAWDDKKKPVRITNNVRDFLGMLTKEEADRLVGGDALDHPMWTVGVEESGAESTVFHTSVWSWRAWAFEYALNHATSQRLSLWGLARTGAVDTTCADGVPNVRKSMKTTFSDISSHAAKPSDQWKITDEERLAYRLAMMLKGDADPKDSICRLHWLMKLPGLDLAIRNPHLVAMAFNKKMHWPSGKLGWCVIHELWTHMDSAYIDSVDILQEYSSNTGSAGEALYPIKPSLNEALLDRLEEVPSVLGYDLSLEDDRRAFTLFVARRWEVFGTPLVLKKQRLFNEPMQDGGCRFGVSRSLFINVLFGSPKNVDDNFIDHLWNMHHPSSLKEFSAESLAGISDNGGAKKPSQRDKNKKPQELYEEEKMRQRDCGREWLSFMQRTGRWDWLEKRIACGDWPADLFNFRKEPPFPELIRLKALLDRHFMLSEHERVARQETNQETSTSRISQGNHFSRVDGEAKCGSGVVNLSTANESPKREITGKRPQRKF